MKLYDYYRSTACYRIRIALNLKKLEYSSIPIHLADGVQHSSDYKNINPEGLVPTLIDSNQTLIQSMAILEYLEEAYPEISLLPECPFERAYVRSIANIITCDMHPLNNLRVLNKLRQDFNAKEDAITSWYHNWLKLGFEAIEQLLQKHHDKPQTFCFGNHATFADLCLIPQVYNAKRFHFDTSQYPQISAINQHCLTLPAFINAMPEVVVAN